MRRRRPTKPLFGLAILIAAMIAACADPQAFLPKPYRPADKGQNRLANMVLSDHIVVSPIRGLDPTRSALITAFLIEGLLKADYIAMVISPPQKTARLYGQYVSEPDGTSSIRWTFHDPWGRTLDDFSLPFATDITRLDPEATATRSLLNTMASATAERLTMLRAATTPVHSLSAPPTGSQSAGAGETIIVTAIFGAPDQGAKYLRKAVEASLRASGFRLAVRPGFRTFRLQCMVSVTESRSGFQRLALSWELKSPDEKVLATIDQANEIPAGSLKEGWTDLAPLVTQGAVTGISNYFDQLAGPL